MTEIPELTGEKSVRTGRIEAVIVRDTAIGWQRDGEGCPGTTVFKWQKPVNYLEATGEYVIHKDALADLIQTELGLDDKQMIDLGVHVCFALRHGEEIVFWLEEDERPKPQPRQDGLTDKEVQAHLTDEQWAQYRLMAVWLNPVSVAVHDARAIAAQALYALAAQRKEAAEIITRQCNRADKAEEELEMVRGELAEAEEAKP